MPLFTEADRRKLVQLEGLNPDQFDYDESTASFVKRQTVQPSLNAPNTAISKQTQNITSTGGAFGANLASGVLPTLGGMGVAALAAAPFTGGGSLLAPLIAGGIGGIAGSLGTSKLQEAALEQVAPEANQYLATAQTEHPYASTLGNIASALPLMRFDPKVLGEAGRAISKKLSTGATLNPVDINALANVGMGAGLGAGMSAVDIMQSDRSIEGRDLLNVLGNVLINNPRPYLKNKLGLPFDTNESIREAVNPTIAHQTEGDYNYRLPAGQIAKQVEGELLPPRQVKEEAALGTAKDIAEYEKEITKVLSKKVSAESEILAERNKQVQLEMKLRAAQQESEELAKAAAAAVSEIPMSQRVVLSKGGEVLKPDFEAARQEALRIAEENALRKVGSYYTDPRAEVRADDPARFSITPPSKDIPLTVKPGLDVERPLPKVDLTAEKLKMQAEEIEMRRLASEPKSEAEMAQERLTGQKERYSEKSELANVPDEIRTNLDNYYGKGNWGITEVTRNLNELLARGKRIGVKYDPTLPKTGKYAEGTATINPAREGIDTLPHEVTHGAIDALANSKNAADRRLALQAHKKAVNSPEYQEWRASLSPEKRAELDANPYTVEGNSFSGAVHEFLTEQTAYGYLKTERKVSGEKSAWEQWKNDFMANMKTRFSKDASLQDNIRALANRIRYDAPMVGEGGRVTTTAREQDLSNLKGELYLPPEYDNAKSFEENAKMRVAYDTAYAQANPGKTDFEFGQKPFTNERDMEGARYRPDARYSESTEFPTSPIGPSKRMMDDEAFFAKYPKLKDLPSSRWSSKALAEYTGYSVRNVDLLREQGVDVVKYSRERTKTAQQVDSEGRAIRNKQGEIQYRERPQRAKPDFENPIMQKAAERGVYMALKRLPTFIDNMDASEAIRNRIFIDNDITGIPYVRSDLRKELTQSVIAGLSKEGIQSNAPMEKAIFEDASKMASREFNKMYQKVMTDTTTETRASAELTPQEKALLARRNAPTQESVIDVGPAPVAKVAPKDSIPDLVKKWDEMVAAFKDGYAESQHMFIAVDKLKPRLEAAGMKPAEIQDLLLGTMEDLGLIGSSVGEPEGRILGSQFERESDTSKLLTQTEKELRRDKPFGLQINTDGTVNKDAIGAAIKKLNPLEQDLLKSAGWDNYFNEIKGSKVNAKELADWLAANGPKVEVLNYGMEGKVSEAKKEYDRMTHEWLDSKNADDRSAITDYLNGEYEAAIRHLKPEDRAKAKQYYDLHQIVEKEPRDTSPRATSAYNQVSALPANEPMPEWTATKSGKNVQRVDVVIPSKKPLTYDEYLKENNLQHSDELMDRWHRPLNTPEGLRQKDTDPHPILWQPDNLHENVPNTLGWAMIQYKTGPNGERIALIAEAQSRWGQERREYEKAKARKTEIKAKLKEIEAESKKNARPGYAIRLPKEHDVLSAELHSIPDYYIEPPNHPLLRDYNRLILKAAIDQARKEGATHIMISDAETAMMTEGHDLGAGYTAYIPNTPENLKYAKQNWTYDGLEITPTEIGIKNETPETAKRIATNKGGRVELVKPPQEPGMRFNYDASYVIADKDGQQISDKRFATADEAARYAESQLRMKPASKYPKDWKGPRDEADYKILRGDLPSIMTEITGDEGTRVSLGEHKNAVTHTPEYLAEKRYFSEDEALQAARVQQEVHTPGVDVTLKKFDADTEEPYWRLQISSYSNPRSNLIFRNADGTPKTDVSGTMFDISLPAARLQSGEQMTMSGKRYSDFSKLNPIRFIQPELDSLKDSISPKLADVVVPAFDKADRTKDDLYGKFGNRALKSVTDNLLKSPKDAIMGSNESTKRVLNALYYERDMGAPASHIALTPTERNVIKELRDTFKAQHDWQRSEGPLVAAIDAAGKVTYRPPMDDPYYVPHMTDNSVVEVLMRKPDSDEANRLRDVFRAYRTSKGQSAASIEDSLSRFQPSKAGGTNVPDFNAVRVEEGLGLPPEWREKDLTRLLRRYNDRWSTDMAFYKHIQSDPVMRRVLDIKDDGQGNIGSAVKADTLPDGTNIKDINLNSMPQVQTIMRGWNRSYPVTDVKVNAANRLIKAFMMQTVTGVTDVVQALPTAMKMVRPEEIHLIPQAVANWKKGVEMGLRNGTIRLGASAYEDIRGLGMETGFTKFMEGVAATTNKVFGRESLEEVSRGLTNALGGLIGEARLGSARSGNKKDVKWFDELGLNVDWKTAPVADVIDAVAARVTELNQGTYNYRDLPRWAIEGSVAPLVSLAKWNVSQFNNFNKTVIKEMRDGNPAPLLMATVGALIGGAAVEELRQLINKRKPNQLTNAEYFATGEDTAYKFAALASLSGFAGIATEMAKTVMDVERGNRPQGFTFPFAEVIANVTDRVGQFSQALDAGTKVEEALLPFVQNIITDHIQMARVAMHQFEPQEETMKSEAQRDRRVFQQVVKGESVPLSARSNPMVRPSEKEFKRTESVEDAARMLPKLLEDAMARSGGDYEKMKKEFQRLKANSIQTFPSPEQWPIEFAAQVQWIQKTKGEKAAQEAVSKFLRQREINKVKSKMIPSL